MLDENQSLAGNAGHTPRLEKGKEASELLICLNALVQRSTELAAQEKKRADDVERKIGAILAKKEPLTVADLCSVFERQTIPTNGEPGEYLFILEQKPDIDLAKLIPVAAHEKKYFSLSNIAQDARPIAFFLWKNDPNFQASIATDVKNTNLDDLPLTSEWDTFYRAALSDMARIAQLTPLLHECLRLMAGYELGQAIPTENIDLPNFAKLLARVIQLNFMKQDYVIATPEDQTKRNKIVPDIDPTVNLHTNLAVLVPVILNHLTNAAKAIRTKSDGNKVNHLSNRVQKGELPQEPETIYLRIRNGEKGMVVIEIENSANGVDVNSIVQSIRSLVASSQISIEQLNGFAGQILDPDSKPLTLTEAFSFAELARVSGFAQKSEELGKLSTGNGLAISKYLITAMGGKIGYSQSESLGGLKVQIEFPTYCFSKAEGAKAMAQLIEKAVESALTGTTPQTTSPSTPASSSPESTPAPTLH